MEQFQDIEGGMSERLKAEIAEWHRRHTWGGYLWPGWEEVADMNVKPRSIFSGYCPRCGVDGKQRRHLLCRDCRDVLSVKEQEVWAA